MLIDGGLAAGELVCIATADRGRGYASKPVIEEDGKA